MSLGSSSPIVLLVDDDDIMRSASDENTMLVPGLNANAAAAPVSGSNAIANAAAAPVANADATPVANADAAPVANADAAPIAGSNAAAAPIAGSNAAAAPIAGSNAAAAPVAGSNANADEPNVKPEEPIAAPDESIPIAAESSILDVVPEFITSAASNVASTIQEAASAIKTNVAAAVVGVSTATEVESPDAIENGSEKKVGETSESQSATMAQVALGKDILTDFGLNQREIIEKGLQEFNQLLLSNPIDAYIDEIEKTIEHVYPNHVFIKLTPTTVPNREAFSFSGPAIVSYCNPSISGLSDFAPHYNLFILTNFNTHDIHVHKAMDAVHDFFLRIIIHQFNGNGFKLKSSFGAGPQISLRLHIGEVFNIPIFTTHIMNSMFETSRLPGVLLPIEPQPFIHNAKPIGPYNQLDMVFELLIGVNEDEPYAQVNSLIARGMNELCVKQFMEGSSPNAVIQQVCDGFIALTTPTLRNIQNKIIKHALIAILQNPAVQTSENMKFSDFFPSGQYASYFDEIAYRCDSEHATGPLMIRLDEISFPVTRTNIIVAALTAINAAMKNVEGGHIVAGGGAAVSYYIQNFITDADANLFNEDVIRMAGLENISQVIDRCKKIPMNDIDCFVFGDVSRHFLLVFSLYMMILYENFYERPKRYHKMDALETEVKKIRFKLAASSDDHIDLFMYGNRKNDANTKLISKRLKKNPKVQLVTQETKCFSQIVHPMCIADVSNRGDGDGDMCKEDDYYMQPIDLVKKDIQEFIDLYQISLYQPDKIPPPEDLDDMIRRQYTSDNMVSMKTTMLDIICIFCDEGKSLFIRIFMARKNPKDFSRLRAFIDLYLLQLLRSKQSNPADFAAVNDDLVTAVGKLRLKMDELNATYYLEQGNLAAIKVETAEKLDADRAEFLNMLRDIGRMIVALPDPFDDRAPIAFQSATMGTKIIDFFRKSRTMKYRFNMLTHMSQLVAIYDKFPTPSPIHFHRWLDKVFSRIKFATDTETFFQSMLGEVMNTMRNPDGNHEIGFKRMPVRSSLMLRLHDALKSVVPHEFIFNEYRLIFGHLFRPIKEHVAQYGTFPTAQYVGISNGVYDLDKKQRLFPTFVKEVILLSETKKPENPEQAELLKLLSELNVKKNIYEKYDDDVKEEIGRIILEYAREFIGRVYGGSSMRKTRKQLRRRRLANANTRGRGRVLGHDAVSNEGANTRKRKHRRHKITRRVSAL